MGEPSVCMMVQEGIAAIAGYNEDLAYGRSLRGLLPASDVLTEPICDAEIALMNGTQGGMHMRDTDAMTWREMKWRIDRVVAFQENSAKHVKREMRRVDD